ncbi:MAG: hypothetical protein ACFFCM_03215, partial [Promethearchaeota archaeon]
KKDENEEEEEEETEEDLLLESEETEDSEGELLLGGSDSQLLTDVADDSIILKGISELDISEQSSLILGTPKKLEDEESDLLLGDVGEKQDEEELLTSIHLTAPIEQETEIKETEVITERKAEEILVAFDGNLNERGKIKDSYLDLKKFLESNKVKCSTYTNVFKQMNVAHYDCLIFACPDASRMNKFEISEITRFVENGGSLLLLSHAGGDRGRGTNLNDLSQNFGIQFINDQVFDEVHNIGLNSLPIIDDFAKHPIFNNIKSLCYRAGCSLEVSGNAKIIADADAIAEPTNAGVCAILKLKLGRVAALGSYEMFRNQMPGGIEYETHRRLFLNIIDWLTAKKDEARIVKSLERFRLAIKGHLEKLKIGKAIRKAAKKPAFKLPVLAPKAAEGIVDIDGIIFGFKELSGNFQDLKEEVQNNLKEMNSTVKGISMGTVREIEKLKEELINFKEDRRDSEEAMNTFFMEMGKEIESLNKKIDNLINTLKEKKKSKS